MKEIIVRGGMSPYDNENTFDVMLFDKVGKNSGNILFLNGIFKSLQTENINLTVDNYKLGKYCDNVELLADEINNKYDKFVIPLANAFRDDFVNSLNNYTKLINKLKIPCIVTGVGMQTSTQPDLSKKFVFDNATTEFISAVLNKSNCIGVRGEITYDYLKKLGFKNHIKIIGCPSMSLSGNKLIEPILNINKNSKVSFNMGRNLSDKIYDLFENTYSEINDCYFLPQSLIDLKTIYCGCIPQGKTIDRYPIQVDSKFVIENRVRYFVNTPSWIDFLKSCNLSVGICIHGTIAAVQAGIPALLIVTDSRTRELAEYYNIPHLYPKDIVGKNIFELCEKIDFSSPLKGHKERFDNYIDFLKSNDLEVAQHFDERNLYEKKMKSIVNLEKEVECFTGISNFELANRLNLYHGHLDRKVIKIDKELKILKDKDTTNENIINKITTNSDIKNGQLVRKIDELVVLNEKVSVQNDIQKKKITD